MGIRGLSTFLKDNRQSLCNSVHLTCEEAASRGETIPVVVDAWSIIYQLYCDSLPWASGGEYLRFYRIVRRLIESWRKVGLEPTFVFDGVTPPEKHDTALSRLQKQYKTALLFSTTSVPSRSAASFSRHTVILPPFTDNAFIYALKALNVKTHFVAVGEADAVTVAIANELGAYVFSLDSDYLILISGQGAGNVKGYCPLDMMMWIEGNPSASPSSSEGDLVKGSKEWYLAGPKRTAPSTKQSSYLPPSLYTAPTLVLCTIHPSALRQRLRLPATHLPLLASLVGNDYVPTAYADEFFEGGLSISQRIEKVARVLREQVFGPSSSKTAANAGDQAVQLIKRVMTKLSVRGFVNDVVLQEMVDKVIEATFQYVIPSTTSCCGLYPFCGALDDRGCTPVWNEDEFPAKRMYAEAARVGSVTLVIPAYAYPGRLYMTTLLEDPSGPSLRGSERLREIRRQAWAIADAGLGELRWPEPTAEEMAVIQQDQALQDLLGVEEGTDNTASDTSDDPTLVDDEQDKIAPQRPRRLVEWLRQGSSNRVVAAQVYLPEREEAHPVCLAPLDARLRHYLSLLSSDTPTILALPPNFQPLIAAIRVSILEAATRADKNDAIKFRHSEVAAFLKAGLGVRAAWEREERVFRPKKDNDEGGWPTLLPRNAGLVSQFNAVMLDAQRLAESLLITPNQRLDGSDDSPSHLQPFAFISGVAIHSLLLGLEPPPCVGWRWTATEEALFEKCLPIVTEGLEENITGWSASPQTSSPVLAQNSRPGKDTSRTYRPPGARRTDIKKPGPPGSRFDILEGLTI